MRGAVRLAIPVAVAAGLVLGEAARALYEQMTTLGVGTVRVAAQSGPVVTRSVLASDVSSTSTAFADTALSLALAANTTYTLRCVLVHTSAATTTAGGQAPRLPRVTHEAPHLRELTRRFVSLSHVRHCVSNI